MARQIMQAAMVLLGVPLFGACAWIAPLGSTPGVLNHEYALDQQLNMARLSAQLLRDVEQLQEREAVLYGDGEIDASAHQRLQQSFRTLNTAAAQDLDIVKDLRQSAFAREDALKALVTLVQNTIHETTSRVTPRAALDLTDSFAALRATTEALSTIA